MTFATYVWLGNDFNVVFVYKALSFLNALTVPLFQLPEAISNLISAIVSAKRIENFLNKPEIPENDVNKQQDLNLNNDYPIQICNGHFKWPKIQKISIIKIKMIIIKIKK